MKSLSQLSRRYLRRQWKRTVFTSLGIVMATALFAGLALLLTSFVNMYVESESASKGRWHYHISGLTMDQAQQLQANIRVKDSELIANSKYLGRLVRGQSADSEPSGALAEHQGDWLLLRDISQVGNDLSPYPMSLLSGRMPQNSSEIVLNPTTLRFFPDIEPGQQIELELIENGDARHTQPLMKTYTVTGIADWRDTQLPGPAYYALTHLDEDEKNLAEVYLTVKTSTAFEASVFAALGDVLPRANLNRDNPLYDASVSQIKYVQYNGDSIADDLGTVRMQTHDSLLRFLGQSSYDTTNRELTTFFGILALIIMVSVIFVIRNSFAMSVSERTSEYGLLRVVGGSPSQIRSLVLQDAVQMAIVSIPVGLLAGIAAMKITLEYVSGLGLPDFEYLKLVVSPWPLVLAASLSILAIMLAAISPAVRAGRLSPMEAVRKSGVYTVKGTSSHGLTRRGRLSRKLTGVTGFLAGRSIRRDRRRFRITTLSVMVSAILFLAAGGISFLFSRQLSMFNTDQVDFRLIASQDQTEEVNQEFTMYRSLMDDQKAVGRIAGYSQFNQVLDADKSLFTTEMVEAIRNANLINGKPISEVEALDFLANNFGRIRIIMANRELLDQLPLSDRDRVWSELKDGKVIISQTNPLSVGDLSFQTLPMTTLGVGDMISVGNVAFADPETGEMPDIPAAYHAYEIAAEIDELPWFTEGFFTGFNSIMLFADADVIRTYLDQSSAAGKGLVIEHVVAVDADEGREAQIEKLLLPITEKNESGIGGPVYMQNNFAETRMSKNVVKGINVFVYGFATVIVLICSMNILNTVTTNVLLRRRELGMLQAVGMSRSQVRQMLLIESSLYGVSGAVWGSVIGTALLYLLGSSIGSTMGGLAIQTIPWNLVLATLAGAFIISIAAGILPIRRVMKDEVVEAIRAQE